jgi:N-acetylglucosamine-6-sulfatase
MHPRRRVAACAALLSSALLALVVLAAPAAAGSADRPPNVVVVMTDDQDFRSLPAMPQTRELIQDRGTTFDANVVNFPLCCPSRATFLTGQYAHNHGLTWNNWPRGGYYKFDGSETLPVWLQRAGYKTIHVGKYLNEYGERDPLEVPPGWSEWWGGVDPSTYGFYDYTLNHNGKLRRWGAKPEDYSTDVYAKLAAKEIRSAADGNKPFFLSLAPNAPHTVAVETSARQEGLPAVPAPRHEDVYADQEMPRYPNFNEADLTDKLAIQAYFPTPLSEDAIDSLSDHWRGRMGSLLAVDDLVATVDEQLRKEGVRRDTVIIYTSDNGWILGEHRIHDTDTQDRRAGGVKYVPFEGSSRVPLLIAGPGFPEGRTVTNATVNADLTKTVLDVANAEATLPQDGRSLRRIARHPSDIRDRGVLIETFENPRLVPPYQAVRTRRYRYEETIGGLHSLYDLKRDPWELQSVHDDPRYAEVERLLAEQLEGLRECAGESCAKSAVKLPQPTGEPFVPE